MDCIVQVIDKRIDGYLAKILPATGCRPHVCLSFDKSTTPHWNTNQAIVLITVVGDIERLSSLALLYYTVKKKEKQ